MGRTKTTEEFIRDAKKVHGDKYDYSKAIYLGSIPYMHKSIEDFEKQQRRDNLLKEYCIKMNITLIVVKYTKNKEEIN